MKACVDSRLKALDRLLKSERPLSVIETQAIERQITDLKTGHERGLVWDEDEASRAVGFFSLLKHWKGTKANQPFSLEPWQSECLVAPLFGWWVDGTREDGGHRRFTTAYIEIPRKNGKTTLASGFANQAVIADNEQGADVYCAATKRDQAKILFRGAKRTLGPQLKKHVLIRERAVSCEAWQSKLEPLSNEDETQDGLDIHRAIVDELHAHKTRGMWDVLLTGVGARANPMIIAITTAGYDRSSICWEQREEVVRILKGDKRNDAYFGFIATVDDGDDWQDPQSWWKANPNLGVSLTKRYMENICTTAQDKPAAQNNFRQKNLDEWTGQSVRWLSMDVWKRQFEEDWPDLRGMSCWGGVDLSDTRDVTALVLVFELNEQFYLLPHFWMPSEAINKRAEQDQRQIRSYAQAGFVTEIEGPIIRPEHVAYDISQIGEQYRIEQIAYDPWQADTLRDRLENTYGFPENGLIRFRQRMENFAFPTKRFEELLIEGKLFHDGNPVLRWMASNVAAKKDVSGNIRPDKENSGDKIDGIVAGIMGLALALAGEKTKRGSIYDKRGLREF